jgi:hypothetical protein
MIDTCNELHRGLHQNLLSQVSAVSIDLTMVRIHQELTNPRGIVRMRVDKIHGCRRHERSIFFRKPEMEVGQETVSSVVPQLRKTVQRHHRSLNLLRCIHPPHTQDDTLVSRFLYGTCTIGRRSVFTSTPLKPHDELLERLEIGVV